VTHGASGRGATSRGRGAFARIAAGAFVLLTGCGNHEAPSEPPPHAAPEPHAESLDREPLQPLPDVPAVDPRLVALGRRLFFDARLSSNDRISCASCHDLENGGDDGQPRSRGAGGELGAVNAPTVFNASLNFAQFWDGRARTLEDQIDGPVTHPEMNTTWPAILEKLAKDAEYVAAFRAVFGGPATAEHVRGAIATFERTLLTRGSPFDRWLDGDRGALSEEQKKGYELFKSVGCVACHQGRNVGGNMFQRFGVLGDYFADRGSVTRADYGRFNVTGSEADRFFFRVPSLRNVERTAPYFHDGTAKTLSDAVSVMARYQLGRKLSDEQVASIVAFLGSLSGNVPETARRGAAAR
jgi:cytochrome c peroxidase